MPKQFPFDRREWPRHTLCTLNGLVHAHFTWLAPYERPWEANTSVVYPAAGSTPVIRRHGSPRAQGWTLAARTKGGAETEAMRNLLAAGWTLGLYHSATRCAVKGCTIERHQPVVVLSWNEARLDGSPTADTNWSISLLTADRNSLPDVPDTTWYAVKDMGTWRDVEQAGTWYDIRESAEEKQ